MGYCRHDLEFLCCSKTCFPFFALRQLHAHALQSELCRAGWQPILTALYRAAAGVGGAQRRDQIVMLQKE